MPKEIRLWAVSEGDRLTEVVDTKLDFEARLAGWLARDVSILGLNLLVIGKEVPTQFGGFIDILCIDQQGDLVVVELKRDKTPREITAQALDYGSWVAELNHEQIEVIADRFLGPGKLPARFKQTYGIEMPDAVNENHGLVIVGSRIDPSTERIIRYLSDQYGVRINAVTFQYFKDSRGAEYLGRVFLMDPNEVERKSESKVGSKRRWNLSTEELRKIASDQGVGTLYESAVEALSPYFQRHTTLSSINFTADLGGSRKTVISLLPKESSREQGLRFQVYIYRLAEFLELDREQVEAKLPSRREEWKYYEHAEPDLHGYRGYFSTLDELKDLLEALA